jgi:hypothetical protein
VHLRRRRLAAHHRRDDGRGEPVRI